LAEKRKELETKFKRMEESHYKKTHISSEGAYRDSAKDLREVYEELSKVAEELGDPVPLWF
tara:strand:+ start:956 stop:1138 length:183 start_codon:yes stop_codon:yes gene_type:complete